MVLQLLVRDQQQHLHILPSDDDTTLTKPLHITLPHRPSRPRQPRSTAFTLSPHSSHPLFSLPLDLLLLTSSFLHPPTLPLLLTLSPSAHTTFRHSLLWQQLSSTLHYLPSISPPPSYRYFTLTHHNALTLSSSLLLTIQRRIGHHRSWQLKEGRGEDGVVQLETRVGRLPEELRCWLVVCDGEDEGVAVGYGVVEGCRMFSGAEMVRGVEGVGEEWMAVTEWGGVNRVIVNRWNGSVWMQTGTAGVTTRHGDDWLSFLSALFPS